MSKCQIVGNFKPRLINAKSYVILNQMHMEILCNIRLDNANPLGQSCDLYCSWADPEVGDRGSEHNLNHVILAVKCKFWQQTIYNDQCSI